MPDLPNITPETEAQLANGLRFANMMSFSNLQQQQENQIFLNAMLELLVSKNIIRLHELEERKKQVKAYFDQQNEHAPKLHLVETPNKYEHTDTVEIDCENRTHLCKAACCRLWFSLSTQDLDEGIIRWNYSQPYAIAKKSDDYCVHCATDGKCSVYKNRPLVCRTYSCKEDKRIWLDFANKIPNPNLDKPNWTTNTE
jgi:Fe-S-cluster containining protein